MKRKVWIILAFLVVLASLCFGAAQAETYTMTSMRLTFFDMDTVFYVHPAPEVTWEGIAYPDYSAFHTPFQSISTPACHDPECRNQYLNDAGEYYIPELEPGQFFYCNLVYQFFNPGSIDVSRLNVDNVTVQAIPNYAVEVVHVGFDSMFFSVKIKMTKLSPQAQQNWEILFAPGEGGSGSMNKLSVPNGTHTDSVLKHAHL